jgi:hypothetical protein
MVEYSYKSDLSITYNLFVSLYRLKIGTYDQLNILLYKRVDVNLWESV